MINEGTYFYNDKRERIASADHVIPVTLYKGMVITIHGFEEAFEVVEWSYHHGQPDEEAGLQIMLSPTSKKPVKRITQFGAG